MKDKGFTLVEILVSLTLLTVVLGAVYGSFFSVQKATERFDNVSMKYHEARTTLDIIRREIESAFIKNSPTEDKNIIIKAVFIIKDRDIFGKSASSLDLTVFSYKGSKVQNISYLVKEKYGKLVLVKTESPVFAVSKGYTIEVIDNIESFTVETLYNSKWVKTWDSDSTGTLPEIIRVSIEFDDNGKPVTLSEYADPKIGTEL